MAPSLQNLFSFGPFKSRNENTEPVESLTQHMPSITVNHKYKSRPPPYKDLFYYLDLWQKNKNPEPEEEAIPLPKIASTKGRNAKKPAKPAPKSILKKTHNHTGLTSHTINCPACLEAFIMAQEDSKDNVKEAAENNNMDAKDVKDASSNKPTSSSVVSFTEDSYVPSGSSDADDNRRFYYGGDDTRSKYWVGWTCCRCGHWASNNKYTVQCMDCGHNRNRCGYCESWSRPSER